MAATRLAYTPYCPATPSSSCASSHRAAQPTSGLADVQADVFRRSFLLEPSGLGQAGGWTARNEPEHLQAQLEADTYSLTPTMPPGEAPAWQVSWKLRGVGRAGQLSLHPVAAALAQVHDNTVRFQHGEAFAVEYVNSPEGIRQNFHVARRPAGSAGSVEVVLAVQTTLQPEQTGSGEISFRSGAGTPAVLTYNGLKAWDATGKVLPARMHLGHDQTLRLAVDDTGATYPVTIDPVATTPFATLIGEASATSFGYAVSSAGDVNGDGFDDVIVGAYVQNRAYVYYGGQTGLTTNTSSRLTNDVGGNFGYSVSGAGDINGDGYDDVLVGAPVEGKAYVYYGSRTGLTGSVGTTLVGEIGSTSFGFSVAGAGDVNHDGLADVVVGAEAYNRGQGRAYVFYGTRSGLGTTVAAASASMVLTGEAIFTGFGYSVAGAGDVNHDGFSDIIVGAYAYNSFQGRAYLFLGSSTGTSPTASSVLTGQATFSNFGSSVAGAGDVNGDGYADVLVGAVANQQELRRAYVYYGNSQGLPASPGSILTPDVTKNTQFGGSVAGAGDLNHDGFGDIIVGAQDVNNGQGLAYVYYGRGSGLPATVAATEAGTTLTAGAGSSFFGNAVAGAGDVNGDGNSDVVVGARGYTANLGRAYVYAGSGTPPPSTIYRLNSGGPAYSTPQGLFAADDYYSPRPGATYSTTASINGTNDDALYQTERYGPEGTLSYALPVENGTYRVVLHFAEFYWNEARKRIFDVSLEGATVLDNYDIFQKVGANTATAETFTVTVTDNLLNIDLSSLAQVGGRDNPKLSALEVRPQESIYQLNSGGPSLRIGQSTFAADDYFSPAPGTTYSTSARIAGTPDDALYQTERYGSTGQLRYALPVTNGTYQVVLHFAEIYWSGPGQRVFDVSLEGARVLDNYDIFVKAGANTAITETFTVTVNDGILNLDMSSLPQDGGVDYPKLSALQILPSSLPVAEVNSFKELQAYPNPSTGDFTVALTSTKEQAAVLTLTDGIGRKMHEQHLSLRVGANYLPVKTLNLAKGMYYLSLRPQDGTTLRTKVSLEP
ncbi:malectin domain-containing carbohydrate-binding protein [Hymenobacter fodinae]|nr:malectin domain-containing carbohydrate-binding protein [Hymenobacter fodinae]